jgi:hypothetical protein
MQLKMIFHENCGTGNMNGKGIAGFVAFGSDFSQGGTKVFVQEQIGGFSRRCFWVMRHQVVLVFRVRITQRYWFCQILISKSNLLKRT